MTEREAFEAWAREYGYDIDEPYDPAHADAWLGWSARAARAQPAQAVPLLSDEEVREVLDAVPANWLDVSPPDWDEKAARAIERAVRAKMGWRCR